jgi:cell division protein FtsZ
MQSRGPALMGTGFGRGENRSVEAAQEAISSPLLDNVTIEGAQGVLINITGGMDLTIDEVTTIASIIQEAAGDESEIIFGAVHDPSLHGEVRVTVIATGLDGGQEEPVRDNLIRPNFGTRTVAAPAAVAYAAGGGGSATAVRAPAYAEAAPFQRPPQAPIARHQLTDLDIPTFIRRQMD